MIQLYFYNLFNKYLYIYISSISYLLTLQFIKKEVKLDWFDVAAIVINR